MWELALVDVLQVVISGLLIGGVYAAIAIGLNIIFGVMGVINMAHGEFLMIGSYITYWVFILYGMNPYLSPIVVVPIVAVVGLVIYLTCVGPLMGKGHLPSLLSTFGVSIVLINIARILWTSEFRGILVRSIPFSCGGITIPSTTLFAFIAAIAMTGALRIFLDKTMIGKAIRATAQEMEGAMLVGINSNKIYALTFMLGCAVAGFGGVLISLLYPIYPEMGGSYTMISFLIVIMGGLGSLSGALVGGFILGLIQSFSSHFIGVAWESFIAFVFIIIILLLRPKGIIGRGL